MLNHLLITELFAFLLVFCRLGSAIMLLPGFGEAYVTARIRLLLAVMFSIILAPTLHTLPAVPATVPGLAYVVTAEIAIGVFIGGLSRMLIATMNIAGSIIAFQSSLSSALTANIAGFQGQDTSLGNLLSMSAVVLLFALDLHHLMLRGIADSYSLFAPGQFPLVSDFADHAAHMMSSIFTMALKLSAPNIVVGLMLYLGAGILTRLMPNMQIFFILMAPQLLLSFFMLMVTFASIEMWYMDYFRETLAGFLAP
jgi:flagellar biosynthetic protein FliR